MQHPFHETVILGQYCAGTAGSLGGVRSGLAANVVTLAERVGGRKGDRNKQHTTGFSTTGFDGIRPESAVPKFVVNG